MMPCCKQQQSPAQLALTSRNIRLQIFSRSHCVLRPCFRSIPVVFAMLAPSRSSAHDSKELRMTTVLKLLSGVCAVFLVGAGQIPPASAQVPGFRGIDHIGLTVPDLEKAVDFFVNVIGCEDFFSDKAGPFDNDWMKENLNVDPKASLRNHRLRCGNGANFELFEYQSPDQRTAEPKNS